MGRSLIAELLARGHTVRAVIRETSRDKLPAGCDSLIGDALDERSYAAHVAGCDVFVHLVGVPHPSPAKAAEFQRVDLASIRGAVAAATSAAIPHFV
jgi:nucleoside-diphosphate-sugar epimerase